MFLAARRLALAILVLGGGVAPALADVPVATSDNPQPRDGAVKVLAADVGRVRARALPLLVQVSRRATIFPASTNADSRRLLGTGVSIGGGCILTTAGVVGPALDVQITHLGKAYDAKVLGVDRRTNLAVLQADGLVLASMPLPADKILFPGDFVVALGIGPDSAPQASFGVVVVAEGPTLSYGADIVQTTAPPYPGLSGGVLLNAKGEMVGLVSGKMPFVAADAILPPGTSMVSGVLQDRRLVTTAPSAATVAVPVGEALDIARTLAENGKVERGYIGLQVELVQIHPRERHAFPGVLVHRVVKGSPADEAGILPGDVILEYASAKVDNPEALSQLVAATVPGAAVPVLYLRRGATGFAQVHIVAAPEPPWDPGTDALISSDETAGVAPSLH